MLVYHLPARRVTVLEQVRDTFAHPGAAPGRCHRVTPGANGDPERSFAAPQCDPEDGFPSCI
jgi:hypothetical protein